MHARTQVAHEDRMGSPRFFPTCPPLCMGLGRTGEGRGGRGGGGSRETSSESRWGTGQYCLIDAQIEGHARLPLEPVRC